MMTPGMWCARLRASPGSSARGRRPHRSARKRSKTSCIALRFPVDKPKPKLVFERNEQVRIVDGPFANFTGQIEEVNADRGTLKDSVTICGRSTPLELDFAQRGAKKDRSGSRFLSRR